jgi:predicted ArsR family transcriptional regulator
VTTPAAPGGIALAHPLRAALLGLLREHATLTSTEAARLLGHSSGLCSFHLRQLARYGYIEEAAQPRGRVRPWRLAVAGPDARPGSPAGDDGFGALARELEDEGYRRWLAHKHEAEPAWRRDEAFSVVLHLAPDELAEAAAEIRAVLRRCQRRGGRGRRPVGAVIRLFPLLPTDTADDR